MYKHVTYPSTSSWFYVYGSTTATIFKCTQTSTSTGAISCSAAGGNGFAAGYSITAVQNWVYVPNYFQRLFRKCEILPTGNLDSSTCSDSQIVSTNNGPVYFAFPA